MIPGNRFELVQWTQNLKEVAQSLNCVFPLHLALSNEGRCGVYTQPQIDESAGKLMRCSLKEIVMITLTLFAQATSECKGEKEARKYNVKSLLTLKEEVIVILSELINPQQKSNNSVLRHLGNSILLSLSVLPPYWLSERHSSNKSQLEVKETQNLHTLLSSLHEMHIFKDLQMRLNRVPAVVNLARRQMHTEEISQSILLQIRESIVKKNSGLNFIPLFAQDIQRGVTFIRKDTAKGIVDQKAIPSKELKSELLIERAVEAIAELTAEEVNKPWEKILQAVTSQTSLSALFGSLKGHFCNEISCHSWKEDETVYYINCDFSEELPPIVLTIHRDLETAEIEQVLVSIQGSIDLFKVEEGKSPEIRELIRTNAVEGSLQYTLKLSPDDQPFIEGLKFHLTCAKDQLF